MVDVDEDVLAEAASRGDVLFVEDLVSLLERHHTHQKLGVPRDLVVAYCERLAEADTGVAGEDIEQEFAERLVDDEEWAGPDALYAVGEDRVSRYPLAWHRELAGEESLPAVVDAMTSALPDDGAGLPRGGAGAGIPEEYLLEAASVLTALSRETAAERLRERRADGDLEQDADQHPNARVRLA